MKKSILFLIAIILNTSVFAQKLSADQAKADLTFCYDVLKVAHPSLYRYTKEEEYNWVFDFLKRGIVDSINRSELAEKINVLLSTARCVHTSASNSFTPYSKHYFNFNLIISKGKLYARNIKELSPDTSLIKIISINNIPTIEIVSRMMMLKSGDGFSNTFNEAILSDRFNSFFNVLYKVPVICSVEFETKAGIKKIPIERTLKYTAKSIDFTWEPWANADSMNAAYLLKNKNYKSVRVLRITSFKKNSKAFYQRVFAKMEQDSVKKLIIDLRGNTGGNIYHAFELLNHLIAQDLTMYAEREKNIELNKYLKFKGYVQWYLGKMLYDVYPNGQRWSEGNLKKYRYSFKSKKSKNFNPELIVLIDGQSVSSASLTAAYLKFYTKAKFIGTETGGTFVGNNGRTFPEVILPNSGIKIRVPLHRINYFPGVPDAGRGVIPDIYLNELYNKKDQEIFFKRQILD